MTDLSGPMQRVLLACVMLSLCMTPALGSVTVLIMAIAMLMALPIAIMRRGWNEAGAKRWLWASFLAYLLSLFVIDVFLHGDIKVSLRAIAPSTPLLAAAIVAMALDPVRARVAHKDLGEWASLAVLGTVAIAVVILQMQPQWQILGRSLTAITHINDRLSLLVGNPLPFAGALLSLGFMCLLGWDARGPISRMLGLASMGLAVLVVAFWSQSRGATLAALPLLALALWYLRPQPWVLLSGALILIGFAALVLDVGGAGQIVAASNSRLMQGLATLAGDPAADASTWIRLVIYKAGLAAWWDSPIFGYGVSQRFWAVVPYLPSDFGHRFSHLHNTFITHAVAGGIIGLTALMAVLLTPFAIHRLSRPQPHAQALPIGRDGRYFAWLIFLSLTGVGLSGVILHHDVSANFLGTLMIAHLLAQSGTAPSRAAPTS